MSNWDKLRNRFLERDRDLDAEFEQFLNESLSEDSVTSPRNRTPDLKRKDFGRPQKAGASKPWWETSAEDESSKDNVIQSWFKPSDTVKEEDETEEVDGGQNIPTSTVETRIPLDTGMSVTMSKDSLDEGGAKHGSEEVKQSDVSKSNSPIQSVKENEEDYSYTEPTGSVASTTSSPRATQEKTGEEGHLTENTETRMNTQKEQKEKQEFFQKLENEKKTELDYHKLNEMLDEDSSLIDQARTGDFLQATGVEIRNSIFNTTGLGNAAASPEKQPVTGSTEKDSLKPSMLSKVSLMDSLESSMGTAHQQKIKKIRQKHFDLALQEDTEADPLQDGVQHDQDYSVNIASDDEDLHRGTVKAEDMGTGTEFLNTSGVGELADLQEALQAAQMGATDESDKLGRQENLDEDIKTLNKPSPNVVGFQAKEDLSVVKKLSSDGSREQQTDTVPGVSQLRPVIASTAEDETKAFSYSPSVFVPTLNQTLPLPSDINGGALERQGILLSRTPERGNTKPVLENQDIFLARQTGFPSSSSKNFELREMQERAKPSISVERVDSPEGISSKVTNEDRGDLAGSVGDFRGLLGTAVGNNERHGFSLQPVADALQGPEVTSDDDTPPAESLKGIKSIVKKRRQTQNKEDFTGGGFPQGTKRTSPKVSAKASRGGNKYGVREDSHERKGTKQGKQRTKLEVGGVSDSDRSRFGWRKTSQSTPSREQRGKQGITGRRKDKHEKSPQKQLVVGSGQTSPAQLMASVESFANYLNSFVHRAENEQLASRMDLSREDFDSQSLDENPGSRRLLREQALQKEVEHWRSMWHEERNEKEKLVDDLAEKDKEWKRREQALSLEYKKEINYLKQKVFVLESRLKDVTAQVDNRKRVVKGVSLKAMSEDDLRKLEKEIREQDQLLTGYQQENERLYEDLKNAQARMKTAEAQMFKENQKLASEVASLKEKLERKEGTFGMAGAAALGAQRIHELYSQVKMLKTNEQEMRKELDELENERMKLSKQVKNLERERDMAVQRADEVLGTNSQALHDLESTHATNLERLNRKLKWYAENQELLDRDAALLRKRNEEVQELRDLVQRLEAERGNTVTERDKRDKERAGDAKRIQDLERQVREMEQIIKRRYPNSIPALIYAAAAAPGDGKPMKAEDSPKKPNSPSYAFLENRVKKLDRELEAREEEWARGFRVLEQKYNAMQLEYEDHVKELQRELTDAREKVTSYTQSRARATAAEKELEAEREKSKQKTQELHGEIRVLREALRTSGDDVMLTEPKVGKTKRGKKDTKGAHRIEEDLQLRLKTLSEECERKDRVIEELRSTCGQLQCEREEMLTERKFSDSTKGVLRNLEERLDVVNSENRQLRDQLSQINIELDQQRVRYQGSLAEVERMARQEREASHDELRSLRAQHKNELERTKGEYAAQHSRSKIAEMSNKIAGLEIVIERLKDKLAKSAETEAEVASRKVREEVLKQEINQLKRDLRKAKQCHTPEMQHYTQLEDKIVAMETRHSQRERELQGMIQKPRLAVDLERDEVVGKWRNLLRTKTEETERFRVELDSILSVLEELRRQGVVIPAKNLGHLQS